MTVFIFGIYESCSGSTGSHDITKGKVHSTPADQTGFSTYLINCSVKVAQCNEGHVILNCVHQGRHAQLQQLFGAEENLFHYNVLQSAGAPCFSGRIKNKHTQDISYTAVALTLSCSYGWVSTQTLTLIAFPDSVLIWWLQWCTLQLWRNTSLLCEWSSCTAVQLCM